MSVAFPCRLTQRAPDGWESPRFQTFFLALAWFRQSGVVSSRPPAGNAHRWAACFFLEVGRWAKQEDHQRNVRSFRQPARFAQFLSWLCSVFARVLRRSSWSQSRVRAQTGKVRSCVSCIVAILALAIFSKMVVVFCLPSCHNVKGVRARLNSLPCFEPRAPAFFGNWNLVPLSHAAQHGVHPTGGTRRVFRQFAWLEVGSVKVVLSPPAHPRVTHTVGLLHLSHE